MSVMKKAIRECMSGLTCSSQQDVLTAQFIFEPSFVGFNGHFPDNPVLPGVSIAQCVLVMYEEHNAAKIRIASIQHAKFMSTVSCHEEIAIECAGVFSEQDDFLVKAKVSSDNGKVAFLKLLLRCEKMK